MTREEELELLEDLRNGSNEAMAKIYKLWGEKIFKIVRLIVENDQDARDIRQEVFVSLWMRRHQLQIKTNLRNYLLVTARNMALNSIKKKKTRLLILEEVTVHQDVAQPPPECEEPPQHAKVSYKKQLMDAVEKMPKQRASIFRQVKLEGKTPQMVAESEQIKESTVRSHIQKALAYLRNIFGSKS